MNRHITRESFNSSALSCLSKSLRIGQMKVRKSLMQLEQYFARANLPLTDKTFQHVTSIYVNDDFDFWKSKASNFRKEEKCNRLYDVSKEGRRCNLKDFPRSLHHFQTCEWFLLPLKISNLRDDFYGQFPIAFSSVPHFELAFQSKVS